MLWISRCVNKFLIVEYLYHSLNEKGEGASESGDLLQETKRALLQGCRVVWLLLLTLFSMLLSLDARRSPRKERGMSVRVSLRWMSFSGKFERESDEPLANVESCILRCWWSSAVLTNGQFTLILYKTRLQFLVYWKMSI